MSKITNYLNEHIAGDVVASNSYQSEFATDGSVLALTPHLIVHPRMIDDVRKIARFTWRLAERGQILPLTARGNGTDLTGAAIGRGAVVSFPAHMDQIMEFDLKSKMVRVQSGMTIDTLNQAVSTQGLCLPIDGGNSRSATIGGALATNLAGRRFAKYGCMRDWVENLEIVLSNGEIIQTGRISHKELNEKKGFQTLEGEIYRAIDSLIDDNPEIVEAMASSNSLDAGGYALDQVRGANGSLDLTPLLIGSQGTLGIITQAILRLIDLPVGSGLMVAALTGEENLSDLSNRLLDLEPAALEFIDGSTLSLLREITGYQPWGSITEELPYGLLFIEFDGKPTNRLLRKAAKIIESTGIMEAKIATEAADIEELMTVYDSVSAITNYTDSGRSAIPLVTDLAVDASSTLDAADEIRQVLKHNHTEAGLWGNVGSGLISVRPVLNLANLGQRQIVFRLLDKFTNIAAKYHGSITGCAGPGRLLEPWSKTQYDKEVTEVFSKVRKAFDPYGVLNTGVRDPKVDRSDILAMLRQDYYQNNFLQYNLRG